MYKRLSHPSNLWISGILSAIFLCLVVALGGSGGSSRPTAPNAVTPMPYSGGLDVSQQPSTRFLVSPNRYAVVTPSKADKGPGLDHGGGPDLAILPDEIAFPENFPAKQGVTVVQHAPHGNAASGYDARAPPALI